ncbi:hypothetical protein TNCV_3233671 [Trichonephila clavipes]|nr:hypothetical protein TNCV_3233671 [Trichonephila clavipes]
MSSTNNNAITVSGQGFELVAGAVKPWVRVLGPLITRCEEGLMHIKSVEGQCPLNGMVRSLERIWVSTLESSSSLSCRSTLWGVSLTALTLLQSGK